MEREREFTRDASHELRTPLPVIRPASERLSADPGLGADRGDGLADIIMELAGDVSPHALFGLQQAFSQPTITRQLAL